MQVTCLSPASLSTRFLRGDKKAKNTQTLLTCGFCTSETVSPASLSSARVGGFSRERYRDFYPFRCLRLSSNSRVSGMRARSEIVCGDRRCIGPTLITRQVGVQSLPSPSASLQFTAVSFLPRKTATTPGLQNFQHGVVLNSEW